MSTHGTAADPPPLRTADATTAKTSPIPTRFDREDFDFLQVVSSTIGISVSDAVRRSVKLARRQSDVLHSCRFMVDLLNEQKEEHS